MRRWAKFVQGCRTGAKELCALIMLVTNHVEAVAATAASQPGAGGNTRGRAKDVVVYEGRQGSVYAALVRTWVAEQ